MLYTMPPWSRRLANLYWMLRYYGHRDQARRRKFYRRIAAEKKRLQEAGVDGEEIRLLCRHLANPRHRQAVERLGAYTAQLRLGFGP